MFSGLFSCHWGNGHLNALTSMTDWPRASIDLKNTGLRNKDGVFFVNRSPGRSESWWRHRRNQMETFSALLAICAGNSPVPVNSPHKGQWRGALMFSLICARINDWVSNREAGDLRRHRGHYYFDVIMTTMASQITSQTQTIETHSTKRRMWTIPSLNCIRYQDKQIKLHCNCTHPFSYHTVIWMHMRIFWVIDLISISIHCFRHHHYHCYFFYYH